MRSVILLITLLSLLVVRSGNASTAVISVPKGWQKFKAKDYFTFYMPRSMRLTSEVRCEECGWGSDYKNSRMWLFAEYTSWNEEHLLASPAKQKDYMKELVQIDGRDAKIQSWRNEQEVRGYTYIAEARFYESEGKLLARLWAHCKTRRDVETVNQIFRTVDFRD